jgi:hypothetical protein
MNNSETDISCGSEGVSRRDVRETHRTPPREVARQLNRVNPDVLYRLVPVSSRRERLAIAVGRFPGGSVSIR